MSKENIPKDFDLSYQWDLFCQRCEIPEHKMPEDQRREMKRAFFGACGQLLILMRDELMEFEQKNGEEAAANILEKMLNEVGVFWQSEMDKQSGKRN